MRCVFQYINSILYTSVQTSYKCEDDRIDVEPAVVQFNRKLSTMEEVLSAGLDVYKTKYVSLLYFCHL